MGTYTPVVRIAISTNFRKPHRKRIGFRCFLLYFDQADKTDSDLNGDIDFEEFCSAMMGESLDNFDFDV